MNLPWTPAQNLTLAMSDDDLKRRFAQMIYERPANDVERMNAAKLLFPRQDQVFIALTIAQEWPRDPVVIAELDRLKSSGSEANLPTKADVARRYINLADDQSVPLGDRMKALDKYAELMGMKPASGGTIGVGVHIDQRRVFVLPPQAKSLADWEKGATSQQQKLIEGKVREVT